MKKLIVFAVCLIGLAACKNEKPAPNLVNIQQNDSLQKIIAQKDNEINDMMGTLNEIQQGFDEINQAENRVSIAKDGEGSDKTQLIRENIQLISQTMKRNRELINKLRQQARESSVKGDQMKTTIAHLMKQFDEKDKQLQQLREGT